MSTAGSAAIGAGRRRLPAAAWADYGLSAMLAVLAILLFVIQPLGELGVAGHLANTVCFSLLMVSAVWAVAEARRSTIVVGAVVLASLIARWLRLWRGNGSLVLSNAVVSCVFCVAVAAVVLAQVFRRGPITFHRIQGAIASYILLGLAWAFAYEAVATEWPGAFVMAGATTTTANRELLSHFVYFSLVTLTTVGYGDVTALHPVARSLVTIEALVGQLFPAILLARLVSMELSGRDASVAREEIRA